MLLNSYHPATMAMQRGYQGTTYVPTSRPVQANKTQYYPIQIFERQTIKRLLWRTGSAGGNGNYDIGLYSSDAEGFPATLVASAGSTTFPAANTDVSVTVDQILDPGLYWIAFTASNALDTAHAEIFPPGGTALFIAHLLAQNAGPPLPASPAPTRNTNDDQEFVIAAALVRDA